MIKKLLLLATILIIGTGVFASDSLNIKFFYSQQRINNKEVTVSIKAIIGKNIKLYALKKSDSDVLYSTISFDTVAAKYLNGQIKQNGSLQKENDASVGKEVYYFVDSVQWQQTIKANSKDSLLIKGKINYLYKNGDEYLPGEEDFKFYINPAESSGTNSGNSSSLWLIFLAAIGGGLLALLTPCVYSMIPVTVSFFTKRSKTKEAGIKNAVIYALSIIIIFTGLGFLITLLFGPSVLNNLSTNWIANLIFFIIFVAFGFSFLGAFEITLPSSWSNKSDSKAGTGNIFGIFFMALTLVLVSFSCTCPIIGNLLVLAAKGNLWGPLVGMLGFSLALALPFALFAFFPSKLNILGKAGGWLNAIKVTLGFLELALALKFLSNADLSKGWRILDREVYISLWIVLAFLLGLYLLGKIKFHHDDELPKNDFGMPYLTVTRLMFAIVTFSFMVYMIPGLWGAPLKAISSFVPPMGTQDFNTNSASSSTHTANLSSAENNESSLIKPVKYVDKLKIYEPEVVTKYGLTVFYDYNEALAAARKLHKPLMLDFTGINCINCRKMEGQVWSDPEVMKRLKENFVIVSLYVDVNNIDLPENEIYFSKTLNKNVETLGDKNADLQVTKYGANSQPYYFFIDNNENKLSDEGYGYDPDIQKFIAHLDEVKSKFDKAN